MTLYSVGIEPTRFFLKDLRAIVKGESGYRMTFLHLYLTGIEKSITTHVYTDEVEKFIADWESSRDT